MSNGACTACSTGCAQCSSSSFCKTAADGYFLELLNNGENSGQVTACTSPCATCSVDTKHCDSCITGYNLNGSTCLSAKHLDMTLTMTGAGTNPIELTQNPVYNGFTSVNRIYQTLCYKLPSANFDVTAGNP